MCHAVSLISTSETTWIALDYILIGQKFDAFLMDIQMPVKDGIQGTRDIRKLGNNIPIVGISATVEESLKETCMEAGMNDLLSKPFQKHDTALAFDKLFNTNQK